MDTTVYEKLLNAAFRFVSFRMRSKKEITDFLYKKIKLWNLTVDGEVERVMDRLHEYGHVDDKKFAAWWVEQRNNFRPKGRRAIVAELRNKGVTEEIEFDELASARASVLKKIRLWSMLPVLEQKKKLYSYLTLSGFTSTTVRKIIDESVKKDYNE